MSEKEINGGLSKCEAFTHPQPHSAMQVMPRVVMRAKMQVSDVTRFGGSDVLKFNAVCKPDGYPSNGADEDNSFARWTPTAQLTMTITNPELFGKFERGDKFYLDFTLAE